MFPKLVNCDVAVGAGGDHSSGRIAISSDALVEVQRNSVNAGSVGSIVRNFQIVILVGSPSAVSRKGLARDIVAAGILDDHIVAGVSIRSNSLINTHSNNVVLGSGVVTHAADRSNRSNSGRGSAVGRGLEDIDVLGNIGAVAGDNDLVTGGNSLSLICGDGGSLGGLTGDGIRPNGSVHIEELRAGSGVILVRGAILRGGDKAASHVGLNEATM